MRFYRLDRIPIGGIISNRAGRFVDKRILSNSTKSPINPSGQFLKTGAAKLSTFSIQIGRRNAQVGTPSSKTSDHRAHHANGELGLDCIHFDGFLFFCGGGCCSCTLVALNAFFFIQSGLLFERFNLDNLCMNLCPYLRAWAYELVLQREKNHR
jgi:hypothetical protein